MIFPLPGEEVRSVGSAPSAAGHCGPDQHFSEMWADRKGLSGSVLQEIRCSHCFGEPQSPGPPAFSWPRRGSACFLWGATFAEHHTGGTSAYLNVMTAL